MSSTYKNFKGIANESGDVLTNPQIEECLYVNGALKTPDENGVIALDAQGTYVITGRHYGRIVIGKSTDVVDDDTQVILDGVEIYANDSNAYGIYYAPTAQSIYVTLAKNKSNVIYCQYEQEMAEQQGACLYSENNMVVQGSGYLSVVNKGGHGIKASELRISGHPHIYAEAVHDAVHGNSALTIDGGYFYVAKANDGFGTGSTGAINVFGGTFRCYGISQNAFDSKVAGTYYKALDLRTDAATAVTGMTAFAEYAAGTVKEGADEDSLTEVSAVDGTYACTGLVVVIEGLISGNVTIGTAKTDVTLNGAHITGSLTYTLSSSNMQVNSAKDTVNIVDGGISSSNNVKIEVKGGSHLIVTNTDDNAIQGSELTIRDSKGTLMVSAPSGKYGIQGTDIYIADSADHGAIADEGVYGAVMVDSIYARLTSKGKKGNVTIKDANLVGCVTAESISAATGSTETTGINLYASKKVFYHELEGDTIVSDCGETYEHYDVIPFGIGACAL